MFIRLPSTEILDTDADFITWLLKMYTNLFSNCSAILFALLHWRTTVPEELTVLQLVKKCPGFYATQKFRQP